MSLAPDEFLQAVLAEQTLDEGSVEREELLAEARRAGLELEGGRIVIGTWRESV